jgi:mitochondrial inner membrane protein COX18
MANVESGNWVLNAAEREQERKANQLERKRILEGGKIRLLPGVIKTCEDFPSSASLLQG